MAGIYFHIPFCKSKCNYCNFYSISDLSKIDILVESEIKELNLRKSYIDNEIIHTIYFGGGTPSLLSLVHINKILGDIRNLFKVSSNCEITFEVNPEDLSENYLSGLFFSGINRLSVGIQSYNDSILQFMGRRHDSNSLSDKIKCAKKIGFDNISIDIIFGVPGMTNKIYYETLDKIIALNIQHISAYGLTIEKGTYFHKLLKTNEINLMTDNDILIQFNDTIDILSENGFCQYELSNFARNGFISRHNSSYWEDIIYLGIGPSAHSYNGISRQWNVKNTINYCSKIKLSEIYYDIEYLSDTDKYNEYILTRLRTIKGISLLNISNRFPEQIVLQFNNEITKLLKNNLVKTVDNNFTLTRKGMEIADFVIRSLCVV
jgi:oxygen-independent coproporphyrinogen III oxidase